jgi:hypothetical protein
MTAIVFRNDEVGYLGWIENNPNGCVINTFKNISSDYLVLHGASCHTIKPNKSTKMGAFTERGYIKICATSKEELLEWMRQQGYCDFSQKCI